MNSKSSIGKLLTMLIFALCVPGTAFAYSYTIRNMGAATIYWAHAHTVSGVCHDVGIDMPQPDGLMPGMSVSFSTSSICLVDSLSFNVNKAGGQWDFSSPAPLLFPFYPPNWSSPVGMASGTFTLTPNKTCFNSGFLDGLSGIARQMAADVMNQNPEATAINMAVKELINAIAPEYAIAMTMQSAAYFAVNGTSKIFNLGIKTPSNPTSAYTYLPVDPAVNARNVQMLRENVGCGW